MKKLSLVLILVLIGFSNACLPTQKPTDAVCVVDYDIDRDYDYVIAEFERNCELLTGETSFPPAYTLLKLKQSPFFHLKVLYVQGNPVGFIFYHYHQMKKIWGLISVPNIQWLAVNEAHRGKGYSKLLLESAFFDLKNHSFNKADVSTGATNQIAQKLYTSLGFTEAKRCDKYVYYIKDLN